MAERIEGLAQVTRKLKAFDAELGKDVKSLNLAAAEQVALAAKAKAPIGSGPHDEHPGQLLLSVVAGASGAAGYVKAGGTNIPYAAPVHWGWPGHNISPQPFLREATLEEEPALVRQYKFGMDALLHKAGLVET